MMWTVGLALAMGVLIEVLTPTGCRPVWWDFIGVTIRPVMLGARPVESGHRYFTLIKMVMPSFAW